MASWLSAVSVIALVASGVMVSQPATAASGGSGVSSGTIFGGAAGADGTAADATGKDGFSGGPATSGGGGGAVDLTTGQGAHGGSQWNISYKNKGVPGADGAAGANTDLVNRNIVGAGGILGASGDSVTSTSGSGGGGGGGGVSTDQFITVTGSGSVVGGAGGNGGTSSGGGGGGVGIFTSAGGNVDSGGAVTGGKGGDALGYGGGGGGAAAILMTGGGILTNSGTIIGGAGGGTDTRTPALGGVGGNGGEGILLTNGGTVVNKADATITGGNSGKNGTNLAKFGAQASKGGNGISGANVSIVNAGTISGGATTGGGVVDAIRFTGGVNSLEIWSTSVINGNVQAYSSADKFTLGGGENSTFDVSTIGDTAKYRGFGGFGKTGTSSWTLTGTNTGVTPWTLSGGTLSISQDESLGDEAGDLTFNGGTLQTTDSFEINRAITLTVAGGAIETATGTVLTVTSAIDGAGGLTKLSAGTLVLTGNNSYAGGTTISAGTLQLGNGGTTGSTTGDVLNNGTLAVNRSDTLTLAGTISGTGSLDQFGTGTTILTGNNNYTGGTTISAGTLQLGNGGTTGSITGDVLNNGTLAVDRSDTLTLAGKISGTGLLNQSGTGTTILTGNNSYTGGTTISAGTLQLGNGGTTGSITGDVLNNGTLAVNRSDALTLAGAISGTGSLDQIGTGTTILTGNNSYAGGTTISDGTLQIGNGGTTGGITGNVLNNGVLMFKRSDLIEFGGVVSGTGTLLQSGTGTLVLTGNNSYSGQTDIEAGTLVAGGDNVLSSGSAHSVLDGAKLDLDGHNQTIASLNNAGAVYLNGKSNTVGTTFTIAGDYVGNNGTIIFNTELAGDTSKTDRLVVNGDTAGSTNVQVRNLNGTGALTVDGIKLIEVGGASDGAFSLQGDYVFEGQQAVVGGAYAYRLYQNGVSSPTDGDWYLRSELKDKTPLYQAGVPVYEAYAGALLNLNSVSTLQQRVGTRYANNGAATQGAPSEAKAPAVWGRIEAAHSKLAPNTSTSSTDYDLDTFKMQAGLDGQFYESTTGNVIGGLTVHYSKASADANSFIGNGKIDIDGYGFGGTLTWYGQNGFYVDGQAQATWYKSDLFSHTMDQGLANGNDAFGYVLSVEAGQRFDINQNWSLTPQAQMAYSSVDFDSFNSVFKSGSAHVSLGKADSLKTRLGISADYQNSWIGSDGKAVRSNVYGIANLYHEFLDGTDVNVSGVNLASENDRTWGGLGAGGTYSWANDKYALYGEVSLNTSLSNFADSYSIGGTSGFKIAF
ncbi:autotransporter outer membrane beta-barrel domain-containing protein [Brucella rhizosphaerae]|nr:autotransporter outer membrane beta-barrel domain-containing protein [Brucella rhizosphaerae]